MFCVELSAHSNENVIRHVSQICVAGLIKHPACQLLEWIERYQCDCKVAFLLAIDRRMLVTDFVEYETPESPELVAKKQVATIPDRIRFAFSSSARQVNDQALERRGRITKRTCSQGQDFTRCGPF